MMVLWRLLVEKKEIGELHLANYETKNGIFSIESLVGECRLHAVRFFGNLAADGTPFFCSNGFLSV